MKNFLLKLSKYFLSFFKKDWNIEDYPIVIKNNSNSNFISSDRLKVVRWVVIVLGWLHMQGNGDTKEEALLDLHNKFINAKKGGNLPRPGTTTPLILASTEGIKKYSDLALDFFDKILDVNYNEVFISDESSIWDFVLEGDLALYYEKIKDAYGIDVSSTNGNFLKIFENIENKNPNREIRG